MDLDQNTANDTSQNQSGPSDSKMTKPPKISQDTWIAVAILVLTLGVYHQVVWFDFVTFDDPVYITRNPTILKGLCWESLQYAFTNAPEGNYIPLVWLTHAACVSLFNSWAGGHHLVSLLFHALNSVLLFYFLKRLTSSRWPSAMVAFLFALHPLHVESVAWVAERKDVVSTLFWILTSWAYLQYVERPSAPRYLWTLLLFALGLLSKSMLVTLPLTLLLMDIWPLRRIKVLEEGWAALRPRLLWPIVREKLPLFLLSMGIAAATFLIQRHVGAMSSLGNLPLHQRVTNGLLTTFVYLRQMVWPVHLSAFYPISWLTSPVWKVIGCSLLLGLVTGACLWWARRRPYLIVGWLWYLITLLPVIGIVQVGGQAHADRYTYVPLIGIFLALAFLAEDLAERWRISRRILLLSGATVLGGLCTLTAAQAEVWRDNLRLFANALSLDLSNPVALMNIGDEYLRLGQLDNALAAYTKALSYSNSLYLSHFRVGYVLELLGRYDEALAFYQQSIRRRPEFLGVNQHLGHLLTRLGRYEEAAPYVARIRQLPEPGGPPNDQVNPVTSVVDWAIILHSRHQLPLALKEMETALGRDPKSFYGRVVMGRLLHEAGRIEEGNRYLAGILNDQPQNPEDLFNLGAAFLGNEQFAQARRTFDRLKTISPQSTWSEKGTRLLEEAERRRRIGAS